MKLSEILKDKSMVYLATVDAEGQPKSRVVNHQFIVDGKVCFGTSNQGNAYAELTANPKAEISQFARAKYVRVTGEVKFAQGEFKEAMKAKLAEASPQVVAMYTEEGFAEKMEIVYFENPAVKVIDMADRSLVEVELA